MTSYGDTVHTLTASKLFIGMPPGDQKILDRIVQRKSYPAGRPIFQEGQQGDGLYIISQGQVAITKRIERDQPCVLAELGPGEFFGEMAVVDDQPRSATATAMLETQIYFMPREDFLDVLRRCPGLSINLAREFSARMAEFNQRYREQLLQSEKLAVLGRFAHTFVRQFKSPIEIIGLAAEAANSDLATLETRRLTRDGICKQVDQMKDLINEFLEFTRETPVSSVLANANYADLVRPLIADIRSELVGRSISFELENDPPEVSVLVDPIRVGHVFHNLVNNACDAMPDGGRIKIRFDLEEGEVITEIEDSGRKLPVEFTRESFEPFLECGDGLELAICKRIIEDHQGKIRMSNEPGGGTAFTFNLPRAHMASLADAAIAS